MKEVLEKIWKYVFGGLALFLFGVFIGHHINTTPRESLQGNIFRALPGATYSNLFFSTTPNATMSNATNGNATNPNATNANYRQTYNLLMLNNFRVLDHNVKAGERENITLTTYGACLSGATLYIKKDDGSFRFSAPVKRITEFPYIEIPYDIPSGNYHVEKVLAIGRNYDDSTFSVTFSGEQITKEMIHIENTQTTISINNFNLKQSSGELGGKVYVTYSLSEKPKSIKLSFKKLDGKVMDVNVRSLYEDSYFMIPSNAATGDYRLFSITISTNNGFKKYSIDDPNPDNQIKNVILLSVKEGSNESYVYDNNSIENNHDILQVIYVAPENINIYINAESNSLISEEIFNTIKGTNKKIVISYEDNQIVFNGEDIEMPKLIDATVVVKELSENKDINNIIKDGVIISFPDNGNLPGKANVRIKANDLLNDKIGKNKAYIYMYNEATGDFTEIDSEVKLSKDGYYEFTIDHNSDYVLVTKQLDKKYLAESANVVSFQRGDRTNLVLIICGVILIIGVLVTIVVLKNNQKTSTVPFAEIEDEKKHTKSEKHKEKKE